MIPAVYGLGDRGSEWRQSRRAFVTSIMQGIGLVPPWTVDEFVEWLSVDLKMTIELRPAQAGTEARLAGECGLVAIAPGRAVIWYDTARSERHQRQTIFHELAHLLCRHHVQRPLATALASGDHPLVAELPTELVREAFAVPDTASIDPRRAETEAELVGTMLAVKATPMSGRADRVLGLWRS